MKIKINLKKVLTDIYINVFNDQLHKSDYL